MCPTIAQQVLSTLSATDISDKAARVYFESLYNRYCDPTDTPTTLRGGDGAPERSRLDEIEAKY